MKFPFQTVVIIISVVAFIVAVIVFSGLLSKPSTSTSTTPTGHVTIWGVLPTEQMNLYIGDFNSNNRGYTISYEQHSPEAFYQDLIVALANNNSPDVIIYSSEIFSQFKDKLYAIPYAAYGERQFRDTNIDGAQIFLSKNGVLGLPLLVDPIVVYYNKDILASKNYVLPPTTWTALQAAVPALTKLTSQNGVSQSAIALGQTQNIAHYRDILSALFLQTGNSIMTADPVTGLPAATLSNGGALNGGSLPTADAVTFYTSFTNPTNLNYSWNRSLPESLDMFLAGKSAFYVGRASELFTIQAQNPNLNFDVMELFQPENKVRSITYGSYIGISVMKTAPNFTAAYSTVSAMSAVDQVNVLSTKFSLPPARRDLLLAQQSNPYVAVFFRAALSAFSWPDPNVANTNKVFRAMIDNVTSGSTDAQTAINEATRDLQSGAQ